MEKKYYCPNPGCKGEDGDRYIKSMSMEIIMDEKNLAQMYCPHCKGHLLPLDEAPKEP